MEIKSPKEGEKISKIIPGQKPTRVSIQIEYGAETQVIELDPEVVHLSQSRALYRLEDGSEFVPHPEVRVILTGRCPVDPEKLREFNEKKARLTLVPCAQADEISKLRAQAINEMLREAHKPFEDLEHIPATNRQAVSLIQLLRMVGEARQRGSEVSVCDNVMTRMVGFYIEDRNDIWELPVTGLRGGLLDEETAGLFGWSVTELRDKLKNAMGRREIAGLPPDEAPEGDALEQIWQAEAEYDAPIDDGKLDIPRPGVDVQGG